jgi:hypothetical protein
MEIDSNINNIFLDNSLDLDNSKYLFKDDDIKLFDYQKQTISSLLNHEKGQMTIKLPKNYLSLLENEFHNKSHTYSNNFSRDIQRYLRTREKKFLLKNNMNILDRYHIKVNFGYNIGVLSNTVGSGKTLIILGFIMRNKFFKKNLLKLSYKKKIYNNTKYPSDICDVISEFLVEKDSFSLNISSNHIKKNNNLFYSNYYLKDDLKEKTIIKTNLIIVPHNLFEQWKNEINKTFLKTKYIKDKRNFKDINDILDNKYDIILCNVNKVIQLLEYLPNEKYNFERIFIDEVDIINLPRFPELNTNFLWLITTTYTRILNPKNIGFINDLFRSNYYMNKSVRSFYKFFLEKLTFSFNKTHIQEKLQLIIPNKNFIIVPNNFINTLLYNLKCESWYKYLNSYDYESLYYHILKTKSRNLIKFMLRYLLLNIIGNFDPSIEQTIQNIILNFSFDYENNASILFIIILHRIHRINYDLINRKIIHRIRHINNIVRIIKEHLLNCPICLKDHKRFINNINDFNLFQHDIHYLNDILFSIQSEKCPMNVNQLRDQLKYKIYSLKKTFKEVKKQIKEIQYIKKQLLNNNYCLQCMNKHTEDVSCIESTFYNFFVIVNINFYQFDSFFRNILNEFQPKFIRDIKYDIYQKEEYPEIDNIIEKKHNVKIENMLISLKKDILNKKRCLIFSDNNYFFKNIKYELDSHSISNRTLKGNTNTINSIIRKYKNHDINVLLLNMKHCGSGINLEMSDNIYIMNFLDSETETQVIGRVNRIGKKNNLNINYYLTTHEYDFYKKIISTDKKSNIIIEEI